MSDNMKKILILTDSLGLPRMKPALVSDVDGWVYKVVDNFCGRFYLRTVSVPGLDSTQLVSMADDYYRAIKPDIIIMQVGIVDCYPRAIKKAELSVLLRLPGFISTPIHRAVKKFYTRLISHRKIQYVPLCQFKENMKRLKDMFAGSVFLIVPIAPPSMVYVKKNPLVAVSISQYNEALSVLFGDGYMNDCYQVGDSERIFLSDNHHLNAVGNRVVFQAVERALNSILLTNDNIPVQVL
jgi:acyl-CoA thioesterase-1